MLRDAFFIARKDAFFMLREKETLLWTFVLPIVFFYFIGTVTGGFSSPAGTPRVALMAPEGGGFLEDQLARRVADRGYEVVRVATAEEQAGYNRRLSLPAGFTDEVLIGAPVKVEFTREEGGLGADLDEVRMARAVYTLLADLIVSSEAGDDPTSEKFEALAAQPRNLQLEVRSAGERVVPPTGFSQAVPGTMVMFTLIILLTSGTVLLVVERNGGMLRRLASAPVSRGSVVLGKWGARMVLASCQLSFAMVAGTLFFGVDWGPSLWAVIILLFTYAGLAACLALLIANLVRSEGQAVAAGVIASNVLAALGGCWWPIEVTPAWVQKLSLFLPTGLAMDGMHKLVNFGQGAASVLPNVLALGAAALIVGWLAARRFRFQ